jgi:hypothetical protein
MVRTVAELKNGTCRYINGKAGLYECDEPRARPSPYCARHHAVCYLLGTNRRARSPISLPVDKMDLAAELGFEVVEQGVPDVYDTINPEDEHAPASHDDAPRPGT